MSLHYFTIRAEKGFFFLITWYLRVYIYTQKFFPRLHSLLNIPRSLLGTITRYLVKKTEIAKEEGPWRHPQRNYQELNDYREDLWVQPFHEVLHFYKYKLSIQAAIFVHFLNSRIGNFQLKRFFFLFTLKGLYESLEYFEPTLIPRRIMLT